MKKFVFIVAVFLAAFVTSMAAVQDSGGYLDLSQDPFVEGGLTDEMISKKLLPAFAGYAPKEKADEVIVFSFNCDIPRLQVAFKNATGTIYNKSNVLRKGEKLVATVNSRKNVGDCWEVKVVPRWLVACGNPLPLPVEMTLWIPKWGEKEIVVKRVEVPKPFAVTVRENVIVQQLVPTIGNIELNMPPAFERPRYRLVEVGHEEAGRRWEYQKNFWDNFLDFLSVVAQPLAFVLHREPGINVTANGGAGGAGGVGAAAAAAAASSSSTSSSTAVTPTSGAGSSGGSSGSSGAASDGGSGSSSRGR